MMYHSVLKVIREKEKELGKATGTMASDLEECCYNIEDMITYGELDTTYDCSFDFDEKRTVITIACKKILIEHDTELFHQLAQLPKRLEFAVSQNLLTVRLVYDSLWKADCQNTKNNK